MAAKLEDEYLGGFCRKYIAKGLLWTSTWTLNTRETSRSAHKVLILENTVRVKSLYIRSCAGKMYVRPSGRYLAGIPAFQSQPFVFLPLSKLYLCVLKSSNVQLAPVLPHGRSLFQLVKPARTNAISNVLEFLSLHVKWQLGWQ